MGKLVMAYWDCPYCGNKGVQGSEQQCPSCGRARGDVKFYMKDNAQDSTRESYERGDIEYVDDEQAASVNRNPDWYCSFCNSLNNDDAKFCTTCGATREDSEMNYFKLQEKLKAQEATRAVPAAPAPAPKSKKPLFILLAVILAIVGLVTFMNSNKTTGWNVTDMAWSRTVNVEVNKEFTETDWSLPDTASLVSQERAIKTYQQVLDHYENVPVSKTRRVIDHYETYYSYEDMGNGYYQEVSHERPVYGTETYTEIERQPVYRDEPVYGTRYTYTIWRWVYERKAEASAHDHQPYWPDPQLGENEREGARSEAYTISVEDVKGKETNRSWFMNESDWNNLKVGDNILITQTRGGANPHISDKDGNVIAPLYDSIR